MQKGQSLIEVIIALSIFIIIASSGITAILGSFQTTRLGEEETKATVFANQGLEGLINISENNWNDLVDGSYGIDNISGIWELVTTSTQDDTQKFTREVQINPVYRDINGNMVESGGDYDPNSKYVTSSVSWDFSPTRPITVELTSLLTNWNLAKNAGFIYETDSCLDVCRENSFSSGTCRFNSNACSSNGETYLPTGDIYCTADSQNDTCCCL